MERDFSVEEIVDMRTEGEVLSEPTLTNIDCIGQNDLYKNESHGECNHELFCVTGNDSDYIDIDDLY
jgi:hypothetical protein